MASFVLLEPRTSKLNPKKGFTLVELLVTISIIAILSSIGLVIFRSVQLTARDGIRKQDLHSLARALEFYYQKHGNYPYPGTDTSFKAFSNDPTSWDAFATLIAPEFISTVPNDPKAPNYGDCSTGSCFIYGYLVLEAGQSYRLCANLENDSDKARNVSAGESCSGDGKLWGDYKVVAEDFR